MRIRNILFAAFATAVIACDPTIPVSNVVVVPSEVTIKVGEERTLTAIVSPDNASEKTLIWSSSNMSVVAVQEGTIRGLEAGTATVSATAVDGGKTASCSVTVIKDGDPVGPDVPTTVDVTSVEISPTSLNLAVGKTSSLSANVLPSNATDKSVKWESQDGKVATVSSSGVVTAVAVGTTTIRAIASNGVSGSCPVEVFTDYVPVSKLTLSMHDVVLEKGETYSLDVTVEPSNATNPALEWSSSNSCVTVSSSGLLTAVSGGEANITVSAEGGKVTDVCHITVKVPVKGVSLNMPYNIIYDNETCTLVATIDPEDATDKSVNWSSSQSIVKLEPDGLVCKVIPTGTGTTLITVKTVDGGKTATCELEIEAQYIKATSVEVTPSSLNLKVGETATLTGKVLPENATAKDIQWSSKDSKIATVNSSGLVTAVATGSTKIEALSPDGVAGYCDVTVTTNTVAVTKVTLSQHNLTLKKDQTASLTATVEPSNATDKSLKWSSSNTSVATVDGNGKITAMSVGTAIIKVESATNSSIYDTCNVTVEASTVTVTSVNLSDSYLELEEGDSYTLSASVNPSNATNKSISWSSNNSSVASVDSNGKVTAKAKGNATITAKSADGPYATCTVVVKAKSISVSLSSYNLTVQGGKSVELKATVTPDIDNIGLVWKTTNSSIIKINEVQTSTTTYGSIASINVFGSGIGSADITVAAADNPSVILATCHVTVTSPSNVYNIYFKSYQNKTINLKVNQSVTLEVIYEPSDAAVVSLHWTVSPGGYMSGTKLSETSIKFTATKATNGDTITVKVKEDHCSAEAICYVKITE